MKSPIMRAAYEEHLRQLTQEMALLPDKKRKHVRAFVGYLVSTVVAISLAVYAICSQDIGFGVAVAICLACLFCVVSFIITLALHLTMIMEIMQHQRLMPQAIAYFKHMLGEGNDST